MKLKLGNSESEPTSLYDVIDVDVDVIFLAFVHAHSALSLDPKFLALSTMELFDVLLHTSPTWPTLPQIIMYLRIYHRSVRGSATDKHIDATTTLSHAGASSGLTFNTFNTRIVIRDDNQHF